MSYCRCSTPGSNVYVFGSGQGWEIHIQASERVKGGEIMDLSSWRAFPHKRAGQGFFYKTRHGCLTRLLKLREEGIRVPQCALIRLRDEIRRSK